MMKSIPAYDRLCSFRAILFAMVALCCFYTGMAQIGEVRFDHLSLEDGLSQSNIQWILQDRPGFIWFSTQDGLNKYDGYTFTVYSHDPQNPASLAGNSLGKLFEDSKGNIWIFLGIGGINKFDRATEQFTYYSREQRNSNTLSSNAVTCVIEDKAGNIWFGTSDGIDLLDTRTGKLTHYSYTERGAEKSGDNFITSVVQDTSGALWFGTKNGIKKFEHNGNHLSRYVLGLSNPEITVLFDDGKGSLWAGTRDGLNKLDKKLGKFTQYKKYDSEPNSLAGAEITAIQKDSEERLWIGTTEGLTRFDEKNNVFTRFRHNPADVHSISENNVKSILLDSYGVLWVVSASGKLDILDRLTGRFERIRNNPSDSKSLSHNTVSFVMEDRSGTIWAGTQGGGINKFNRAKQKFRYYNYDPLSPMGLSSNSVSAIIEDSEGMLWVGTQDNGLNMLDRKNDRTIQFRHDPKRQTSIGSNTITALYEDREGTLWVGTRDGLDCFDKASSVFKHYRHDSKNNNSITTNAINCILEDHTGLLWIGTDSGLVSYNTTTKLFKRYIPEADNSSSLSSALVWSLFEDSEGILWVGTAIGALNRYNRTTDNFTRYVYEPGAEKGINNRTVNVIYESPKYGKNILWVGTYSGGLNKFDKSAGVFTHITDKDGLPNNRINGLLEDRSGNFWLSTNKGIARFNPATASVRIYDFTDGLQSNEFLRGSFCKTREGEMFFGGINGMNSFFPNQIYDNPYVPPVVLTRFMTFDKPMKFNEDISSLKEITLTYEDNFFSIEFAALDYASPQKNQYAYKMDGFDYNWISSKGRRYASYTNLDPGAYVFHFKGSNNDDVWNDMGNSVIIHITPPFYKTLWFRILAGVLILGFVYGAYRLRIRAIETQRKRLETLVGERTHELHQKTIELQAARDLLEQRVQERTAELRASNETLKKLKDFNENLIQTMAEGITVFDEQGIIIYANPTIVDQLGYATEELLGKHWQDLVPSNMHAIVHAADERRLRGITDHYELQLIRKDGTRNHFLVGGSPIFENGVFKGSFTVITNITERKRAEEQIRDQAALIENARDAIVVCDVGGSITYWNRSAEFVYGWKKEEAIGKNVSEMLYQESSPEHIEALRKVLEKNEWAGELHQSRKDKKVVIADSRWTLLHDDEGFPKAILLINTDITERVKLQMQFLRTQRLESLGTLASGIAHDLNNVLAPILLAVQILKNKFADESSKSMLETLELSAKRASNIVRQVLTFARGADGKKENLQPKHYVRELESIIHETFPKSITLKTDVRKDVWTVSADATQLHQILLNLCVNARDAMPGGGTLSLSAENAELDEIFARLHPLAKPGRYVVFTVSDTGTGMPKDVIEKIFEPFFTTKGIGKGTGLGLSTVNGIVKSHGGFINVYSEQGKGSTFKVYLPTGEGVEDGTQRTAANLPSGNGELILVVDDEVAIRQISKGTLETYGYKVLTANNGIEAEEIFTERRNEIALLLTDMMMPARGGADTIRALRNLNPDLKIVVASGLVSYENANPELGQLVQAFLPKPYTAEKLLRTIDEVLKG